MSSRRQTATAALHGQALLASQHPEVEALARSLWTEPALLTETGGVIAGSWLASPSTHLGHELIAAGMLLTGPIDRDRLADWIRVGWDRNRRAWVPYHPGDRP